MPKADKTPVAEQSAISKIISDVNKKFGGKLQLGKDIQPAERISTGSVYLDYCLGGGMPMGRFVEMVGNYSSGKTLIALKTIAEAQKLGKTCAMLDSEKTFDRDHAAALGVDVDNLFVAQESTGETVIDMAIQLIESGVDVIFIDSVASLVPTAEVDEGMDKLGVGQQARLMSKAMRKMTQVNKKTLVIFTNQIREKIGVTYGSPEVTSGGRALAFYATIRIKVRRGDWLFTGSGDKKRKVGQEVRFEIEKNKVSRPHMVGSFRYIYSPPAIDVYDELITISALTRVLKRRGAYYDLEGESFHGRTELEDRLRSDLSYFNKVKAAVYKADYQEEDEDE